ncbi:metallopeptidase family protein [Streptomyces telluris]|uniref:Metallopeptidase family protein n=1 Tax=Streptomyces telluris TaxID=2720021 RepID=A0A9X2LKA8_9ACTN|nr:metallopeptidase family protein [Streptomyces telluris]MCQ8772743.1 metallopeptidase family protein [Streptomyces telluris]NJP76836.1 metallopeptidase family protein [Streptomyces telluris]
MDNRVPPPATTGGPPSHAGPRPRHRDRHGRGMRGPIAPPQVPLSVSRGEAFVDMVHDSAERLERRWPQLASVDFVVREVPVTRSDAVGAMSDPDGLDAFDFDGESVPLGRYVAARGDSPDRIVVYRRPVEIRTKNRDERALLVHEVVVEQVAELLGLAPESVDPRYGQD